MNSLCVNNKGTMYTHVQVKSCTPAILHGKPSAPMYVQAHTHVEHPDTPFDFTEPSSLPNVQ